MLLWHYPICAEGAVVSPTITSSYQPIISNRWSTNISVRFMVLRVSQQKPIIIHPLTAIIVGSDSRAAATTNTIGGHTFNPTTPLNTSMPRSYWKLPQSTDHVHWGKIIKFIRVTLSHNEIQATHSSRWVPEDRTIVKYHSPVTWPVLLLPQGRQLPLRYQRNRSGQTTLAMTRLTPHSTSCGLPGLDWRCSTPARMAKERY